MGNIIEVSQITDYEDENDNPVVGFAKKQIDAIKDEYVTFANPDGTMNVQLFQDKATISPGEATRLFEFFDMDQDGKITFYEFLCGFSVLNSVKMEQKAEILWKIYDVDKDGFVDEKELAVLANTALTQINIMNGDEPPEDWQCMKQAKEWIQNYDKIKLEGKNEKKNKLNLNEWKRLFLEDMTVIKMLYSFGLISRYGGGEEIPEWDPDLDEELRKADESKDERIERIKNGIEMKIIEEDEKIDMTPEQEKKMKENEGKELQASFKWMDITSKIQPSGFKTDKTSINPPAASLKMNYVYGYRCFDTRNNLKITKSGDILYTAAAVAILLNTDDNTQKYYLEHNDDICSMDVCTDRNLIATGQLGSKPYICVWDPDTLQTKVVLQGILINGISNVSFCKDGDKIAAVGLDDFHSIVIYDYDKVLKARLNADNNIMRGVIAKGTNSRNPVWDLMFSLDEKTVICATQYEVSFFTYFGGMLKKTKGVWDPKTSPMSALSCGRIDDKIITGMFKGNLILWQDNRQISIQKAHQGPLTCICTRSKQSGIVTGGNDGAIKVWDWKDGAITKSDDIDLYELEKQLDIANCKVSAVYEDNTGRLIVGTRGGEIIELKPKQRVLMRGHYEGELKGLCVHPSKNIFYTSGADRMIISWNMIKRIPMVTVKVEKPADHIQISPDAKVIAVGTMYSEIYIYKASDFEEIGKDPEILHTIDEKFEGKDEPVLVLKFSPDSKLLAVGFENNRIIVYNIVDNYSKFSQIKVGNNPIQIDFSTDCSTIFVNTLTEDDEQDEGEDVVQMMDIEIYDLKSAANIVKTYDKVKTLNWATYNCQASFYTQGIWPACSRGSDVNSCDYAKKSQLLASGDDYSKIKLFRFPCNQVGSGYNKYSGHAACITNVRFSFDEKFLLSIGGEEKSIIQWSVDYDDVGQKAQEQAYSIQEDKKAEDELNFADEKIVVAQGNKGPPFLEQIKKPPSWYTANNKLYNTQARGDIELYWTHGFRTIFIDKVDECRNMCSFISDGRIVFVTAALGVVQDLTKNEQTYFQHHTEDIVSFAKHPTLDIIATGSMDKQQKANRANLIVWEPGNKRIISHIHDFHLRAVVCISFSTTGLFLLSAGYDIDNSITVHDWIAKRLVGTSKTGRGKINGLAWKNDSEFITVGSRHVKFWTLSGRNMNFKNGIFGGSFVPQISCLFTQEKEPKAVTGGSDGNIYIWNGIKAGKAIPAHGNKKISSIIYYDDQILTGGYDGKVKLWPVNFQDSSELFTLQQISKFGQDSGVSSLSALKDQLLIGTLAAELFIGEIKNKKLTLIQNGHYKGQLWGASTSFQKEQFITSGGDNTIRLWDIPQKKMILSNKYDKDIRAVDWAYNGKFIVAADVEGNIYSLNPTSLLEIDQKKSYFTTLPESPNKTPKWIEDIKISKDCKFVAFGAHGCSANSVIDVWKITDGTWKFETNFQLKPGFSGAVTHLDWSENNQYIIANSFKAQELYFYDVTKQAREPQTALADTKWFTFSCLFGWMVYGIFDNESYSNALCASRTFGPKKEVLNEFGKYVLATGEENGDVTLFNWPVSIKNQVNKSYQGHSSQVCRVKFTYNDNYLVSVGGNDKSVFVWKTTFGQDQQMQEIEEDNDDGGIVVKTKRKKKQQKQKKEVDPEAIFEEEDLEKGDEFAACKPWLGAIKAPTVFDPAKDMGSKPKVSPVLDYVFGVREKDVRNNVRYTSKGKIAYHTAAVGIVLDAEKNTQTFFNKHTDDIIAMDVSLDGTKAVTGEIGPKPWIYVWDIDTKEIKNKWNGPLLKGITCIAFNPSATKIAAVSLNQADQYPYAVFDCTGGGSVVFSDKSGPTQILELKWGSDTDFVGVGNKAFVTWKVGTAKPPITKGAGKFGKVTNKLCSVTNFGADYVCGAADGFVCIFQAGTANEKLSVNTNHKGTVECVASSKDFLMSGGMDGKIVIYDKTYAVLCDIQTKSASVPDGVIGCSLANKFAKSIRSIQLSADNKKILIATYGSEIHELQNPSGQIAKGTKFEGDKRLMTGHYTPLQKWTNEIWGLDIVKKDDDKFVSCGDDGTLRMYSISARKQIAIVETTLDAKKKPEKPDKKTGDPADSTKGRCVGVSKDGKIFLVGMKDGTIKGYKLDLKNETFIQDKHFKKAKEWISDITFSHDDKCFAFGSHDNAIYIFSTGKKWKPMGKGPLNKHSSYITHFDFSEDSTAMHSNCGAYELLFWDLKTYKQNPSGATAYRDEQWLTWTCVLGWPVQGIWPECADGTDINHVYRSNDKKYIITADDFSTVKIFTNPCLKKGAAFTEGKGHSSHVTNCKFSNKDDYIFTSGGEDQAIMMWKVK